MTAPEWRDCADPDELAAAVAAGVEVQWERYDGWVPTANQTADQFAGSLRAGITYRIPTSWTWSPEPPAPDEVRDTDPGLIRQLHDMADRWGARGVMETGATLWPDALPTTSGGDPRDAVRLLDLAWGVIANADGWGDDTSWRQAAERWRDGYHRFLDALREEPTAPPAPTPPPAPPWPGAVLSGLVDEDGVPTWLAQAGQVRGEQVRGWRDMAWYRPDGHSSDTWVEVRAPRAMPEPETERVPWWDAVGRTVFDQDGEPVTIEHVECGDGAGPNVTAYNAAKRRDHGLFRVPCPVWGDGTVEVLKDGDQ